MSNYTIDQWGATDGDWWRMYNLFRYVDDGERKTVQVYEMTNSQVLNLLNGGGNKQVNTQLRLHLTANPNIPLVDHTQGDSGQIPLNNSLYNEPSFNFVVDAYNQSNVPSSYSPVLANAVALQYCDYLGDSPIMPGKKRQITTVVAAAMDNSYINLDDNTGSVPTTFANAFKSIAAPSNNPSVSGNYLAKSFVVPEDDVKTIYGLVSSDSSVNVYVHLGYLSEHDSYFSSKDPFRFRPILQVGSSLTENTDTQSYFEFSHPCPPACGEFFTSPMTNPFSA